MPENLRFIIIFHWFIYFITAFLSNPIHGMIIRLSIIDILRHSIMSIHRFIVCISVGALHILSITVSVFGVFTISIISYLQWTSFLHSIFSKFPMLSKLIIESYSVRIFLNLLMLVLIESVHWYFYAFHSSVLWSISQFHGGIRYIVNVVLSLFVRFDVARGFERFLTNLASKWFFTRVSSHMSLESFPRTKSFSTCLTVMLDSELLMGGLLVIS